MIELKVQHVLTLATLLGKGARYNFVSMTTTELGRNIRRSQQAASKHISELEQMGYIERVRSGRKFGIRVTEKGYSELYKLFVSLQDSIEKAPSALEMHGTIVSGMGEGAYYMSMKGYTRQFKHKLGYIPYPGTLNVKLDGKDSVEARKKLENRNGILINGFSDGKRTYGWVKCYPAIINDNAEAVLIVLERTHYDDTTVEIISKKPVKKTLNLSNGSKIKITITSN